MAVYQHNSDPAVSSTPAIFQDFSQICERLSAIPAKLQKVALLADYLRSLPVEALEIACLYFVGRVFPATDSRTLSVSWRTIQSLDQTRTLKSTSITLLRVQKILEAVAASKGKGSRKEVRLLLEELFAQIDEIERKYLKRIIFGEMRIGVAEGLLLEGIARAAGVAVTKVRRANMFRGNAGAVARIAIHEGEKALDAVRLRLFNPVQPMLAALAEEFDTVLREHAGQSMLEFKLDGARVQIHKKDDEVRVFSRHLSDVTASLPDLVTIIREKIKAKLAILEGEVVAVNQQGRPLPFQELMRRFRRVHNISELQREVPIRLHLFDALSIEDRILIDEPYRIRMKLLSDVASGDIVIKRALLETKAQGQCFLQEALSAGHEGLMAKQMDSRYTPGTRGKRWFKIKPTETLDLVVIAAEWGSGRRQGWLSNYHLAARDEESGRFLMLGKTFKGLTDVQFKWMTRELQELQTDANSNTVFVKPELVVEVAYNEIQRSPHYDSQFALRFARIKRIRDDKQPEQADTMTRVRALFSKQFERKASRTDTAKFK